MRRDLIVFSALALVPFFPLCGLPQSATPALLSKSSRVDLKTLAKKANAGDPESQYELGLDYDRGVGVEKNEYEAMRWYGMAANSGHVNAQNNLGYLYETGPKALKDMAEAVKWYQRAAAYGNAWAQFNLGRLYLYGLGVKRNDEEAAYWLKKS